jgi:O-antigen ligase
MTKLRSRRRIQTQKQPILGSAVFFVLCLLLFLAPLVRGGNRQIALVVLSGLGALLFVLIGIRGTLWLIDRPRAVGSTQGPSDRQTVWSWLIFGCLAAAPLWIGVVQLLPWPVDVWAGFAGRAPYLEAAQAAGITVQPSLGLSLNPDATAAAMLAGLPAGAAFVAALLVSSSQAKRVMWLFVLVASLQAAAAVLQLVGGRGSLFFFGLSDSNTIVGTFANRNHFAQLLAMAVPCALYLWAFSGQEPYPQRGASVIWYQTRGVRSLFFGFLTFSWAVLILFSASRGAGVAMALNLALAAILIYLTRAADLNRVQTWGALIAIALAFAVIALFVELDTLTTRIDSDVLTSDANKRWGYALSAFQGAVTFWPWGSGMGTFESVFPRFQAAQSPGYVADAHNDYVQMLMELGIIAPLLALALITLGLRQLWRLLPQLKKRALASDAAMLRLFAGVSLLGLAAHSWAEFNLYIPALSISAGALLGLFLRPVRVREVRVREALGAPSIDSDDVDESLLSTGSTEPEPSSLGRPDDDPQSPPLNVKPAA